MRILLPFLILCIGFLNTNAQNATIKVENMTMVTYPFSEPDPAAKMGNIYPYYRFDGYTDKGIEKEWKMVVLENEYIKVLVAPEIGGKVWAAIDKTTGKEFLYYNKVVKFRDIAMRGPWTSGGLEYNFGDIGHIPTGASPVDYVIKNNADGSVSCIVGALDLPSRTKWNVEIRLPANKAFLETEITWQNSTPLPVTYYHWMNAAAKARGNLEFQYPGAARIGHGGEIGDFPIDGERDISFYENNDFGPYKSYHVLNSYSNFFGGYWHDDDFGFGHMADYDDKPGKKIWIWGLSDQGMIWEDLLTDNDGQYVEYQSGKLFNQAAQGSTLTPFKHQEFSAYDSDHMLDRWFPVKGTGGMVAASEYGVLNTIEKEDGTIEIRFSALQRVYKDLDVKINGETIKSVLVDLSPLELFSTSFTAPKSAHYTIELGDKLLYYSSDLKDQIVDRPLAPNEDFDWTSAYGLFTKGLEKEKQRDYNGAHLEYQNSLEKEPGFAPALNRLALSFYRKMDYTAALEYVTKSLAINTYDAEANYIYGLVNEQMGAITNAKSAYSIATQSAAFRVPGYVALARMHLKENDYQTADKYVEKALQFNQRNVVALEMKLLIERFSDDEEVIKSAVKRIQSIDATNTLAASENDGVFSVQTLKPLISNELPHETYLELAIKYFSMGYTTSAKTVLKQSPEHAIVALWLAHLEDDDTLLKSAVDVTPLLVYPHRVETLNMIEAMMEKSDHWKFKYYAGLIYWYKGNLEKAQALFDSCGNTPDFAPFYSTKAALFSENDLIKTTSIQKAQSLSPKKWRTNYTLALHHYEKGDFKESAALTKPFLDAPTAVGMLYAKSLIGLEDYKKAVAFLEKFVVLPFEGANAGRGFYHQAAIMAGLEAFENKKHKAALEYGQKALLWPRNLGAGKPYDVDERLDNYLIAKAYEMLNNQENANSFFDKIIQHQPNQFLPESENLIFQAKALEKKEGKSAARDLLNKRSQALPDSEHIKWVVQAFEELENQDGNSNETLASIVFNRLNKN
jgi:tetratricopeptide (TPR) repeat protein